MKIAATGVEFSFNEDMYKQIEGVAVGFPLGPPLENIYVGFYKSKLFSNANRQHMYHRYVIIFFSTFHPFLRFTFEKKSYGSLPFPDVLVEKSEIEFITSGLQEADIYRSIFTMELLLSIQEENEFN